ncbi:uncharacterized protein LOC114523925 [Dendronephthya gigantea]|uniref:uncharacterized protein LOC114523925 n=1 Tax=Dendronephthya gigantea TaxID=151771 RepID=UPI00106CAA10|nr:uncharacterized protein LOC114523925 [Dendronephthya gigantea]
MKETAKRVLEDQGSGSGKYSYGTTGFGVIAMTKDEDMLKRKTLLDFNLQVDDCVRQLGSHAIEVLDVYYSDGSVLNVLGEERERLTKTEYNILIAGESSAGKSSLVNLILGEELLPHHNLNTTSTICEVKHGEKRELIAHYNYDEEQRMRPKPEIHPLRTKEECGKNYCEQIAPFVQRKSNERSKYTRVEIFWPHELLEEEIVIVDSPGLGECDEMDAVLMNYLPNAFAFIYVLDVSRAGGIQKDIKEKLRNILKKVKSSDGGVETLHHLAECSLFICNKWDQVKEEKEAIEVQEYGGVTEEFNDLLQKIKTMSNLLLQPKRCNQLTKKPVNEWKKSRDASKRLNERARCKERNGGKSENPDQSSPSQTEVISTRWISKRNSALGRIVHFRRRNNLGNDKEKHQRSN